MGAGGGSGPRRKEGNAKRWRKKMANDKPKLQATYKENPVTGIDEAEAAKIGCSIKVLRDGVLYILRNGKTYNAQGQVVQ